MIFWIHSRRRILRAICLDRRVQQKNRSATIARRPTKPPTIPPIAAGGNPEDDVGAGDVLLVEVVERTGALVLTIVTTKVVGFAPLETTVVVTNDSTTEDEGGTGVLILSLSLGFSLSLGMSWCWCWSRCWSWRWSRCLSRGGTWGCRVWGEWESFVGGLTLVVSIVNLLKLTNMKLGKILHCCEPGN